MVRPIKADLHIHTVLSPCGDLDMSPRAIVEQAAACGLEMIAITDHNSTRQVSTVAALGREHGVTVIGGAELTSSEEAHCLALMPDTAALEGLQAFIDRHLPPIPNDPDRFGYQVIVNADDQIVGEEPYHLPNALNADLDTLYETVHALGGLFIPAHIDKPTTSLTSQLGFVPPDIRADALELSRFTPIPQFLRRNAYLRSFAFITDSDAHYLPSIAEAYNIMYLHEPTFNELSEALHGNRTITHSTDPTP